MPDDAIRYCSICEQGNIVKKAAIHCRNCKHLCHKKFLKTKKKTAIDFCQQCLKHIFPFQLLDDKSFYKERFNSGILCIHSNNPEHSIHSHPCFLPEAIEPFWDNIPSDELLHLFKNTTNENINTNEPIELPNNINFKYYSNNSFNNLITNLNCDTSFSLLHTNIESLMAKEYDQMI